VRILYGVQATGNGHITRSREVIRALRVAGHDVLVLFSGRKEDRFWDIEDLQPYVMRRGLTFTARGGRIRYLDTARNLRLLQCYRDIRTFDASEFDVVLSDFEPLSVRIAKEWGLTSIGIAHQYAFLHPVPAPRGYWLGRTVTRWFAPVDVPIGLHWHHFGHPILPPIIPNLSQSSAIPRKVVIYLPFESEEEMTRMVKPLVSWEFYVYREVKHPQNEGNLHIRPFSRSEFQRDLATAEAVIANAGFALASEALSLGKKLLVKPLKGQFEQQANAKALVELGLGGVLKRLDAGMVRAWLQESSPPPYTIPRYVNDLVRWIESKDWRDVKGLSRAVWARVQETHPMGRFIREAVR
jgi:uncharacterized protein (TIGR00661 family)